MVLVWSTCDSTLALDIELTPSPTDFSHTRNYSSETAPPRFREDLAYNQPVGTIGPGDSIDITLRFPEPLQMEDYFSERSFFLRAKLLRGTPVSGFNQILDTDLTLIGQVDLNRESTGDGGWLGGLTVEQSVTTTLTPTSDSGRISALRWTYTAPDWTPSDTEVAFEFLASMQTRGFDPSELPDPQRDLITFVPEQSGLALCFVAWFSLGTCRQWASGLSRF